MKTLPLISVIIPVYNGETYLNDAIQSLLNQHYKPIEIIVVDDGSTDNTALIAKQYSQIKYIYKNNGGPATARNKGVLAAAGEFIAFLDSDDLWAETNIQTLFDELTRNELGDIIEGKIQMMELYERPNAFQFVGIPFYSCLLGSCIFRKKAFDKVGFFDEKLLYAEDVDWFIRAWENNIIKKRINVISLYYRKHANNMTNNTEQRMRYRMMLYKVKLERARNNNFTTNSTVSLAIYLGDTK